MLLLLLLLLLQLILLLLLLLPPGLPARSIARTVFSVLLVFVFSFSLFLGRLDLIKLVSNVRSYVRAYVGKGR